jgi:hypothetical protein
MKIIATMPTIASAGMRMSPRSERCSGRKLAPISNASSASSANHARSSFRMF